MKATIYIFMVVLVLMIFQCGLSSNGKDAIDSDEDIMRRDEDVRDVRIDLPGEDIDEKLDNYREYIFNYDHTDAQPPNECTIPVVDDICPGCIQLTCLADVEHWDVWNDKIVYTSTISLPTDYVYLYDLRDNSERPLVELPYLNNIRPGVVSIHLFENKAALHIIYDSAAEWYIAIIDISTGVLEDIVTGDGTFGILMTPWSMDIYDDKVVFEGLKHETYRTTTTVFIFNLISKEFRQMTFDPGGKEFPRIYGNLIVFTGDGINGLDRPHCELIDAITGERRDLTEYRPSDQWSCFIWGNKVSWTDHRNAPGGYWGASNTDIYWCELPNCDVHYPGTTNWAAQWWSQISDVALAWVDLRNDESPLNMDGPHDNFEVWAKRLPDGEEVQMVTHCSGFVLFEDKIFFTRKVDPDNPDPNISRADAIFMKEIPY